VLSILPCVLGDATPAAIQFPVLSQASVLNAALLAGLKLRILLLPFDSFDCPLQATGLLCCIAITLRAIVVAKLPRLSSRKTLLAMKALAKDNLASD
jgi:hypothetical protein